MDYEQDPWDDYEEDESTTHETYMTDVMSIPELIPANYESLEELSCNYGEDETVMNANYMIEQDIAPANKELEGCNQQQI